MFYHTQLECNVMSCLSKVTVAHLSFIGHVPLQDGVAFDTVATDQGAVAPITESTAKCVTDRHNDRKMSCEAVEQGQNEKPLKILSGISLQFPYIQTISPINLTNFELQLTSHPDRRKVDYVLNGLRFGFHLGFQPHLCKLKSAASNFPSANEHSSVIDEYGSIKKLVLVEFLGLRTHHHSRIFTLVALV